jgi:hypothetical protein
MYTGNQTNETNENIETNESIENIKYNNSNVLTSLHVPIKNCLHNIHYGINNVDITEKWNANLLIKYTHKFIYPIVISAISNEYNNLWRVIEKNQRKLYPLNSLDPSFIIYYSNCIRKWKNLRLLIESYRNGTLKNKTWFCSEFVNLFSSLYKTIQIYLQESEAYIKRWNFNLVETIYDMYIPYFKQNQGILMPIFYYKIYHGNDRNKYLKNFNIIHRLLFWIYYRRIYNKQFLGWPKRISGVKRIGILS